MKNKIIITGANGYLGQHVIDYLSKDPNLLITALVSPSYNNKNQFKWKKNIRVIKADLSKELNEDICEALSCSDKVFHFAWSRLNNIEKETKINNQITCNLLNEIPNKSNFCFISSVAASPKAVSNYGITKYKISQKLHDLGCCVLVCGLVIESNPMIGSYKLLKNIIYKSPLSIRFINGGPIVYPIMIDDIGCILRSFIGKETYKKTYKLFAEPIYLNDFLSLIEDTTRTKHISINLDIEKILKIIDYMKMVHILPIKIYEKISTFFFKDSAYLSSLDNIQEATFSPIKIR